MLLAVDVGNTQTHLGAFDGERLAEHWRFQTRAGRDRRRARRADRAACSRSAGIGLRPRSTPSASPRSCRRSAPEYEQLTERYLEAGAWSSGPGVKTGMPIRIDNPHEVGADRLVNAVAAYDRFGGACVVVDFGTGDQLRRRSPPTASTSAARSARASRSRSRP